MKNKIVTIKNKIDQFHSTHFGDCLLIMILMLAFIPKTDEFYSYINPLISFITMGIIIILAVLIGLKYNTSYSLKHVLKDLLNSTKTNFPIILIIFLPSLLKTRKLCLKAIKKDGGNLKFVPKRLRDKEMCYEAVKQDSRSLQWTPIKLRDKELCMTALKIGEEKIKPNNGIINYFDEILNFIPDEVKTYGLYFKLVEEDSFKFWLVPEKYRDYELCIEAVKKHDALLHHIPNEFKNKIAMELNLKINNNDEDRSSLNNSNSKE